MIWPRSSSAKRVGLCTTRAGPALGELVAGGCWEGSVAAGRGVALVDRAGAVLQEPGLAAALDRDDLGADRRGDLVGALGAEVQARGRVDPLQLVPPDRDALRTELGEHPLGADRRPEHRYEPRRRVEQRAQ